MSFDNEVIVRTNKQLINISKNGVVHTNVVIKGNKLDEIEGIDEIKGYLGINNSGLTSLGSLSKVGGDIWISGEHNLLESLGQLKRVGGDFSVRYTTNILSLGNLHSVIGRLSLRDSKVINLGKLESVGSLFLPE